MKYYLYVSDAKIDMLYNQLPSRLRKKFSGELRLDLKLLSLVMKGDPTPETRYSKLNAVLEYMNRTIPIGTVDAPEAYFRGTLPMSWGVLLDVRRYPPRKRINWLRAPFAKAVFFSGVTQQTVLGLLGSYKHLVTSPATPKGDPLSHYSPSLHFEITLHWLYRALIDWDSGEVPVQDDWLTDIVCTLLAKMPVRAQKLEFVAKRHVEQAIPTNDPRDERGVAKAEYPYPAQRRLLIGTPIYVAMVD